LATPADLVRDSATRLAGYQATLEELIAEPSTPTGSVGMSPRPADAPLPGNAQAFGALMVIWEAVPRLEARIRLAIAGHPGSRRGGSQGNFLEALQAIVSLSGGLDDDDEAAAARILERLANLARIIPDIDEAPRWRYLRARPCPYCGCYSLKVLLDHDGRPAGRVECHSHPSVRCADGNGLRPAAIMDLDGLHWADGVTETIDLEDA
jgi:hypothetical protein